MSALSISSISSTARRVAFECAPQHAGDDVVGDVLHARVAELRIAQPRDRVVFVEPLLGLAGRLDVPLEERRAERAGDFLRELRLAGAGLALDQQRPAERDRRVHRERELVGRDVAVGAGESQAGFKMPWRSRPWPPAA